MSFTGRKNVAVRIRSCPFSLLSWRTPDRHFLPAEGKAIRFVHGIFHPPRFSALQTDHSCPHTRSKKFLQHTHCQCFSKTPRAGNQCNRVLRFPPFFYQMGFIHIEIVFLPQALKVPIAYAYRPRHTRPLPDRPVRGIVFHARHAAFSISDNPRIRNDFTGLWTRRLLRGSLS